MKKFLGVLAALACFAFAGCASRRSSLNLLAESRSRSADEWTKSITHDDGREAVAEGDLSLQDALRLAMVNNKSFQAVLKERSIARGGVLESYAVALPNLSANGSYNRLDKVTSINVGGQEVDVGVLDNFSAGLTVRQPVFHGGAIPATIQSAKLNALLADEKIRGALEGTVFGVASAYFDALLARHLVSVKQDAVASAERYLDDVKKKKQQGMASEYNVLRAQVEVSNLSAELISQQNNLRLSTTRLLRAIGISQNSEVNLTDELSYHPVEILFEDAVRVALKNRPDLYRAEIGVRMRREALRIAQSEYWPKIDAFVSQEWADPAPRSMTGDGWGDAWTAGATAGFALFDGLRRRGRLVQAVARLAQSESLLINVEEEAFLEIKQAIMNLEDSESFLESQRMNLKHAEEGLRLIQVGYREGVNTEVEVMDGQTALTRAQALYHQAVHAHTMARLNLQKAMGVLAPEPGSRCDEWEPEDPGEKALFPEENTGVQN